MSEKAALRLDWCSHEAARYAVEKWHYSRRMPRGKLAKVGVWEDGRFIGAVLFGLGATPMVGRAEGMPAGHVCELVRVALTRHHTATSRIVALALRMLRRAMPGLRLVVSFADTAQGHVGTIYQAGGWLYVGGREEGNGAYRLRGRIYHPRTLHHLYGTGGASIPWLRAHIDPEATRLRTPVKHKYLMPLDERLRAELAPLVCPYPKPGRPRLESEAPATPGGHEGAAMRPGGSSHAVA